MGWHHAEPATQWAFSITHQERWPNWLTGSHPWTLPPLFPRWPTHTGTGGYWFHHHHCPHWATSWNQHTSASRVNARCLAVMMGRQLLRVKAGNTVTTHEFWLANIQDPCIIGLGLLTHWKTLVDVQRNTIHLG